ncbi:hypothetical protein PC129_g24176 [Phytophthora cactorum]|uniref:Uncharacterized protein n=1 Tax=Phytophthora cactorum TaxID=29920 RepID=A0A8T1GX92_9STRA|nr:hypothetical protein C6341_g26993 [Phytophthora cactorum]KAG3199177.1 hypothetical protein PC129_g24176 [Phytophthora cactorum]
MSENSQTQTGSDYTFTVAVLQISKISTTTFHFGCYPNVIGYQK